MASPKVPILLLGDASVGKTTFLSRVVLESRRGPQAQPAPRTTALPPLLPAHQPHTFNMRMAYAQSRVADSYALEVYDTSYPDGYLTLHPDMIVMCYSVVDRASLTSLRTAWKHLVETHFNYDERMPVMVLGLKRDLRGVEGDVVEPQEGLAVAQAMRCDVYAECSAVSGELAAEAWADVVSTVAKMRAPGGGRSEGGCIIF